MAKRMGTCAGGCQDRAGHLVWVGLFRKISAIGFIFCMEPPPGTAPLLQSSRINLHTE